LGFFLLTCESILILLFDVSAAAVAACALGQAEDAAFGERTRNVEVRSRYVWSQVKDDALLRAMVRHRVKHPWAPNQPDFFQGLPCTTAQVHSHATPPNTPLVSYYCPSDCQKTVFTKCASVLFAPKVFMRIFFLLSILLCAV
jgi:hypothetical protein